MRAFILVREVESEIEGVTHFASAVEFINTNDHRFGFDEMRAFFATAAVGDVFQLQHDEHIVALGALTKASWLR
jgi:hypothetical protein